MPKNVRIDENYIPVTGDFGTSNTAISGAAAGGLTIIDAAGTGLKNRIYKITLTCSATVSLLVSDGFGTYYAVAGVPIVLDYGDTGKLQATSNTAIAVTSSGAANVGALVIYSTE
jgi:hypothetical protein